VAFNLPLSMEEIDIIPTSIISQELLGKKLSVLFKIISSP
jgi:hypothetical protein